MARLHSSLGDRTVYTAAGLAAARGYAATVYEDPAGTVLANLAAYVPTSPAVPGAAIPGAALVVDPWSNRPAFWDLNDREALYISVAGPTGLPGPLEPIRPDAQPQVTTLATRVSTVEDTAVSLPAPTGGDDTAAINAALAASVAKLVRGRPGAAYRTSAPLVIYSGTTLDMTSCTVTLLPGSNCNLLQNRAVATVRRVLDAVTTGGSATVTSATAAFVSGDVGKPITVQGAGTAGAPLTTTISAVTNGTTATLAIAASTTVSGQYAAIGARDSSITVVGGLWDRVANGPSGYWDAHALRFRHVDDLTVTGVTVDGGGGSKYAVNLGDCTRSRVIDASFPDYGSDGVHLNGPCSQVLVRGAIGGTMHDDLVSLTARDSTPVITDCAGDITDVVVETATLKNATFTASALKIVAGKTTDGSANYTVRNVVARNLTGPALTAAVVFIGDSSGGNILDITIDGIRSLGGGAFSVVDLHGGSTVDRISLSRIRPHSNDSYPISITTGLAVGRLSVSDLTWDNSAACAIAVFGSVSRLLVDGVQASVTGGSQSIVRLLAAAASVSRLALSNVQFDAAGGASNALISAETSGQTVTTVHLANIQTAGVQYPLGAYVGTPSVHAVNVTATGMTAWARTLFGGVVTIKGAMGLAGDVDSTGGNLLVPVLGNVLTAAPDLLTTGEETLPRLIVSGGQTASSGQLLLTYFTARKTETINNVRTMTEATAAATPTLCRIGIYSVAANGDLTLVASTVNDTALWAGAFGNYTRALTAPLPKVAGQRYAVGVLYVGTTAPKLRAIAPVNGSEGAQSPRINGNVAGQVDLPSSVTSATVTNSQGISVYAAVTP